MISQLDAVISISFCVRALPCVRALLNSDRWGCELGVHQIIMVCKHTGKRCLLATGWEGQQIVLCHQWLVQDQQHVSFQLGIIPQSVSESFAEQTGFCRLLFLGSIHIAFYTLLHSSIIYRGIIQKLVIKKFVIFDQSMASNVQSTLSWYVLTCWWHTTQWYI